MLKRPILDTLTAYREENKYPWHMPGHKRQLENMFGNPFSIDVTEVPGMDEFHDPQSIILESMKKAAALYGTRESFFLVNGSTCGILAGISAMCHRGDKILVARNCHKSVYNAIRLLELTPVFLYPEVTKFHIAGGIQLSQVCQAVKAHKDIKACVLVSPTYEGVVSDISGISSFLREKGIPLLVDEAHGAHFPFGTEFPKSAIYCGADIVIQSLHKTLPALTQTAICHVAGEGISITRLKEYLSVYQSTSPSYVLMASIDYCIDWVSREKQGMIKEYEKLLFTYRKKIEGLKHMHLLRKQDITPYGGVDYDMGKLVLSLKDSDISGADLAELLWEQGHVVEMAAADYVILMTAPFDTRESFEQLYQVLAKIDKELKDRVAGDDIIYNNIVLDRKMPVYRAVEEKKECIPLTACEGRVSGDYLYAYPPGIPMIIPGEVFSKELVKEILDGQAKGVHIKGIQDNNQVLVLS